MPSMDERVPRRIAIFAFDGAQLLDIAGPIDAFEIATKEAAARSAAAGYTVEIVSSRDRQVRASSGVRLGVDRVLPLDDFDTLLVAGGPGAETEAARSEVRAWLRSVAPRCRRLASVCSGAWLLAETGLLDGRRAVTHWAACGRLAAAHPDIDIKSDAIFVEDGPVWTSAGITSGIDLALAMIEADHGRELALAVARLLVVFLKRPGGQSQFSAPLMAQMTERAPIRSAQLHAIAAPGDDLSIGALAAIAGMSARNFARVFARETGVTPGDFVEGVRIEAARRLLEEADLTAGEVSRRCGFGEPDTMRRAFLRRLGVTPRDYRARFRSSGEPEAWSDVA